MKRELVAEILKEVKAASSVDELAALFDRHGSAVIAIVREHHPSLYVKAISLLASFD